MRVCLRAAHARRCAGPRGYRHRRDRAVTRHHRQRAQARPGRPPHAGRQLPHRLGADARRALPLGGRLGARLGRRAGDERGRRAGGADAALARRLRGHRLRPGRQARLCVGHAEGQLAHRGADQGRRRRRDPRLRPQYRDRKGHGADPDRAAAVERRLRAHQRLAARQRRRHRLPGGAGSVGGRPLARGRAQPGGQGCGDRPEERRRQARRHGRLPGRRGVRPQGPRLRVERVRRQRHGDRPGGREGHGHDHGPGRLGRRQEQPPGGHGRRPRARRALRGGDEPRPGRHDRHRVAEGHAAPVRGAAAGRGHGARDAGGGPARAHALRRRFR